MVHWRFCVWQSRFWRLKEACAPNETPRVAAEDTAKSIQRPQNKKPKMSLENIVFMRKYIFVRKICLTKSMYKFMRTYFHKKNCICILCQDYSITQEIHQSIISWLIFPPMSPFVGHAYYPPFIRPVDLITAFIVHSATENFYGCEGSRISQYQRHAGCRTSHNFVMARGQRLIGEKCLHFIWSWFGQIWMSCETCFSLLIC